MKMPMNNKQMHQMMKKTQPGSMGNDSISMPKKAKKWTMKSDDAWDKKHGVKENSAADKAIDKSRGLMKKSFTVKHSGTFDGKSNKLGHGGRAAQMKAHGVPGAVIGAIARREGAAPGQPNYHGGKKGK